MAPPSQNLKRGSLILTFPNSDRLTAALAYAARGWPVFPLQGIVQGRCACGRACDSPGKHPMVKGGLKAATTDAERIRAWWRKWPHANVGVRTGSGLVVLDVDGPEGLAELKALLAIHGPLPSTMTVRTGNGAHLYWACSEPVRSRARGKLHVRADGGYVVVPPSTHHNGRTYQWIEQADSSAGFTVCALPQWLKEWMQDAKAASQKSLAVSQFGSRPPWLARLPSRNISAIALAAVSAGESTWSPQEQRRIASALEHIPASDYETWFKVGMILKSLQWVKPDGSDVGFDLWVEWSRSDPEKFGRTGIDGCERKWETFTRNDLALPSLFFMAKAHGWHGGVEIDPRGDKRAEAVTVPSSPREVTAGVKRDVDGDDGDGDGDGDDGDGDDSPRQVATNGEVAWVPGPALFADVDRAGKPRPTLQNTVAAVKALGIICRHDLFKNAMAVGGHAVAEYAGEISDLAMVHLRGIIQRYYAFDPGRANTIDASMQLCAENPFDPVRDYLDGLQWDGIRRIERWLPDYFGAADTALNRAYGKLVLIAAVRRVRKPGTKFDQILILEGEQGVGKSEAVRIMASSAFFSDKPILQANEREQQESVQGVWLYEIAELVGIGKVAAERLKQFASRQEDKARPAYARFAVSWPRRCIFIGTTNEERYLQDAGGNRRFWPVLCGTIDLERLRRDRDQLWAEAAVLEAKNVSIVLPRKLWEDAGEEQEARVAQDPWQECVQEACSGQKIISVADILTGPALRFEQKDIRQLEQNRVARILKNIGFKRFRMRENGIRVWKYRRE